MKGVRELTEGYPVELWRNEESGRVVVRAKNEGGFNVVEIDLWDLIGWLTNGPQHGVLDNGTSDGRDSARSR
jgi:hypothetical protein